MTGNFEDFLGESDAAVQDSWRRIAQWRSEMQEAVAATSASLQECVDALVTRRIEPNVDLEDIRYSLYPAHVQEKSGFFQPKKPPRLVIGVDEEILERRTGWALPVRDQRYAIDTEGSLWIGYSLGAGVPIGTEEKEFDYSEADYRSLRLSAKAWDHEGFLRLDLRAWTEKVSASFGVDSDGQVHGAENFHLEAASARKPLWTSTNMDLSTLKWSRGGRFDKTQITVQVGGYDDEEPLIDRVFKDVRDLIASS